MMNEQKIRADQMSHSCRCLRLRDMSVKQIKAQDTKTISKSMLWSKLGSYFLNSRSLPL